MFMLIGQMYGTDTTPTEPYPDSDTFRWERVPLSPLFKTAREAFAWLEAQPSEPNYYPFSWAVDVGEIR